ncbi:MULTISPECIES: protein kinase domain-containing protein [Streptomyces]|uniref:PQQ-binding-like beta-propeller repeat protein n=2 Tax=Streptomyces rimosus subsp. rimosus TaxID=132474 RepID=L8ENX9_STRR1|nr:MULTISPECIES: serine/threonine-protein kinase [Streptomyces]KOG69841.1 serine/threonine protein kinase [Kitasatospora aureofaciens]MYT44092.1 PQQ-binding-like beta-propeller repeat protein [Streptomyces sp. SID5471]KEF06140.1 serine/threonine protein kinase [Streptomyces rimosus]KEF17827.1 serine/threonine protein kinase [Streptomyces rimosus]KOT30206.1 serine/threonine protein kinase [Streptomyces rimosus subsp. rimosus]
MPPLRGSEADPEAERPQYAGRYRLDARLGSGGMGVVHLARSSSGLRLAVKVVHADFAQDPEFRGRFRQEVAAARRVSGAFTAPVVDADPDADRPWMATLYIPGPTLGEHVKRNGPLAPAEVRRLAAGLAEALRDIHRAGVVHRDLKPGNVLLAADGPKVIDFGISRPSDSEMRTETGKLIGTPPFMAPEQFQRPREVGPAADVFALGSVLVHAATGRGPFDSESPYIVAYQVVHDEADLTGVPEDLAPLIRTCLAKRPSDRPTPDVLMRMLHTEMPTEIHDDLGVLLADAPAAGDVRVPAQREAEGEALREPVRIVPPPVPSAAPGRGEETHVRDRKPEAGAGTEAEAEPEAEAGKKAGAGAAEPTAAAPPDEEDADRAGRGVRRRWAAWAALAAVLAGAGIFTGVQMLDSDDAPALQTHTTGGTAAAFRPWHTPLMRRPAGHPAEMPFCTYGASADAPALFCVERGLKAARVDPGTGTVTWRRTGEPVRESDTPPGAPVFSGGLLYVRSPDGKRLEALDPSAGGRGATRWSKSLAGYGPEVRFVGGAVLLTSADGMVTALDSATHKELWHQRYPAQPLGQFTAYGDGRTAYAATVAADGATTMVTAIDPAHGTVRWERRLPGSLTVVGAGASGSVYLTAADPLIVTRTAAVVRYDPGTHRVRRLPLAAPVDDAAAVVRGETAYVLAAGGTLQAVGDRHWTMETSVSRASAPVLDPRGERLYFTGADGRLLAVDTRRGALLGQTPPRLATGRSGYLEKLPAPLPDPRHGRIYAAAPDGSVFAANAENPARW